ncbi:amino acid ABC transporter permease [Treponema primitia]|uniref:amino acid ABC transporter permease n=1 Tax=Treponema primitia TaxID=88058 RepID=UPI0018E167F4|nr:amino acid ABC transporter permease [Treponema primitia]
MVKILNRLITTVPYTMLIVIISGSLGLTLAMGIAIIRIKKVMFLYPIANVYVSFFRSTPPLIHIFLVYYGLPLVLRKFGIDANEWSRTVHASLALVLFNGAHMSEFLRPAYLSVDRGQLDAADSIGMTGMMKFRRVILPQMLPIAWPNIENALIELVKDTSVLFVIGLFDIMGMAKMFIQNDYGVKKLEVYIAAGIVYWCITFLTERVFEFAEYRRNKKKRVPAGGGVL